MLAGVERTSLFCLKIKAAAKKVFQIEFWVCDLALTLPILDKKDLTTIKT